MFKIDKKPTFTHTVPVRVPVDSGFDQQSMKVTFQLDRAPTATVRVRYLTDAGTATRNRDYTHRGGTIIFRAGETSKTANITIRGDRIAEPTETFSVVLSAPIGLQLGANGTVSIIDND